jgi:hypothetical protein
MNDLITCPSRPRSRRSARCSRSIRARRMRSRRREWRARSCVGPSRPRARSAPCGVARVDPTLTPTIPRRVLCYVVPPCIIHPSVWLALRPVFRQDHPRRERLGLAQPPSCAPSAGDPHGRMTNVQTSGDPRPTTARRTRKFCADHAQRRCRLHGEDESASTPPSWTKAVSAAARSSRRRRLREVGTTSRPPDRRRHARQVIRTRDTRAKTG